MPPIVRGMASSTRLDASSVVDILDLVDKLSAHRIMIERLTQRGALVRRTKVGEVIEVNSASTPIEPLIAELARPRGQSDPSAGRSTGSSALVSGPGARDLAPNHGEEADAPPSRHGTSVVDDRVRHGCDRTDRTWPGSSRSLLLDRAIASVAGQPAGASARRRHVASAGSHRPPRRAVGRSCRRRGWRPGDRADGRRPSRTGSGARHGSATNTSRMAGEAIGTCEWCR